MLNGENRMKIKIGWLFVTVLMLTSCGGIRSVRTAKTTAKADGASLMKETLLSAEQQRKYDYFFLEAMRMKGKNEYDAAFGLLQHCLDINPTASSALYEISQYYMFLRQVPQGQVALEQAVAFAPDNYWYSQGLVSLYQQQNELDKAAALLKQNNPDLKLTCSAEEIVDLYWQEASREGVRQDLAFAQALVETGFFRFGGDVKPEQNNFCGLGTTGGGVKGAHFKTPEIGVRAHIQHLLAYTTQKHPSTKIVDPRYDLAHAIRLERGLCDTWYKLNGTWAMSPNYSEKIMGVWQRMLGIEAVETKSEKYKNEHDKKDNKVKEEVNTTEDQHKMRELVDELLKKNK